MQTYKFNTLIATLVATAALLLLMANDSIAAPIYVMYGGLGNGSPVNPGGLVIIDQSTGSVGTLVGDVITPVGLSGIAFNSGGALFGSTIFGTGTTSTLVQINPDTASLISTLGDITVGVGGPKISIGDLSFQPGTDVLFGIRSGADKADAANELYTINTATGVATLVGAVTVPGKKVLSGAIAFAPDGTLYFTARVRFQLVDLFFLYPLDPNNASIITSRSLSNF